MKTRIPEVDILKGFAMICMIIGHSIIVFPVDISHVPWCESLHNFIYSFHMELLFLLSGFLYKKKDIVPYLKGKVNRILVPYLIWGAIFLLMPVLFSSVVHRDTSLVDGISNYLLYGGGYWFLYALFFVFLIYPLFDIFGKWGKMLLLVVIIVVNYFWDAPTILCIDQIMYYLPFFMTGNLLYDFFVRSGRDYNLDNYAGIIGVAFLAVFLFNHYCHLPEFFSILISTTCIMGMISVCAHYIYTIAIDRKDILQNKFVNIASLCGQYSLQLYLFNGFLLVILRIVICSLLHIENPVIIVTAISGIDIIISLLVCKYVLPKSRCISYICGVKS